MILDGSLVYALVAQLSDETRAVPAARFDPRMPGTDRPGLYAWWADEEGLAALSAPFGEDLPPLIYAGQAGATSTRSHVARVATLGSRIRTNHLGGNIGSSTFRQTLSAVLRDPLDLRLERPGALDGRSNDRVSAWIRCHLGIVIAPVNDRATLAAIEEAVLERLDPPLNLMGRGPTAVRTTLRQLRAGLRSP